MASAYRTSRDPISDIDLDRACAHLKAHSGPNAPTYTSRDLESLRQCAIAWAQDPAAVPDAPGEDTERVRNWIERWRALREWLRVLLNREYSRSTSYLQTERVLDESFFEQNSGSVNRARGTFGRLRLDPKPRLKWGSHGDGWPEVFPWLRSWKAAHLTVTEIELALILFAWAPSSRTSSEAEQRAFTRPVLARWVLTEPQVLVSIEHFLRSRYCFTLLGALRRARQAGAIAAVNVESLRPEVERCPILRTARFRLDPFRGLMRPFGLAAVGLLGAMSIDVIVALIFAGSKPILAIVFVAACLIVLALVHVDVHRQNYGVLQGFRHAAPRTLWATVLLIGIGAVGAFGIWVTLGAAHFGGFDPGRLMHFASNLGSAHEELAATVLAEVNGPSQGHVVKDDSAAALQNLVVPSPVPESSDWIDLSWIFLRFVTLGAVGAAVGAIVQWFWEDRSAIEPV